MRDYVVYLDDPDDPRNPVTVREYQTGDLQCLLCNTYHFCPHISKVYKSGLDAKTEKGKKVFLSGMVKVGIYPEPKLVCEVSVVNAAAFLLTLFSEPENQFLGLLVPGEGRLVLRQMILAHLRYLEDTAGCTSKFHPKRIFRDSRPERDRLVSVYQTLQIGICEKCQSVLPDVTVGRKSGRKSGLSGLSDPTKPPPVKLLPGKPLSRHSLGPAIDIPTWGPEFTWGERIPGETEKHSHYISPWYLLHKPERRP